MITIASIMSILGTVATNIPAFVALGADVEDMFAKGTALVTSDTASTADERAAVLVEIEDLQSQFAAGLATLAQQAPDS